MFLSICIPSYNRFEKLDRLVKSLLVAKEREFEIVIVDNGSSQSIREYITLLDNRVRIIERKIIVKGPTNVRMALEYARGEYSMICLDKDYILGSRLDEFIGLLRKVENIACGYCELNSNNTYTDFQVSDNIGKYIYRGGHPSGTFFKTEYIKGEADELELLNEKSCYYNNPFLIDLLYARCLLRGKQLIFKGMLLQTETLSEAAKQHSYSYNKNDNNIYFIPSNRIKQFWVFINHLKTLNLKRKEYDIVVRKLINKTMSEVSIEYKDIMKNSLLCQHHGIDVNIINKWDEIEQIGKFSKDVLNNQIDGIHRTKVSWYICLAYIKMLLIIWIKG